MKVTMHTTMGSAGRLVIPKALRRAAGLEEGTPVEIRMGDECIEIAVASPAVRVERRGRLHVLVPEEPVEPVTSEQVREALEDARRHGL